LTTVLKLITESLVPTSVQTPVKLSRNVDLVTSTLWDSVVLKPPTRGTALLVLIAKRVGVAGHEAVGQHETVRSIGGDSDRIVARRSDPGEARTRRLGQPDPGVAVVGDRHVLEHHPRRALRTKGAAEVIVIHGRK
jgi:hypothetical protein